MYVSYSRRLVNAWMGLFVRDGHIGHVRGERAKQQFLSLSILSRTILPDAFRFAAVLTMHRSYLWYVSGLVVNHRVTGGEKQSEEERKKERLISHFFLFYSSRANRVRKI
jgi:hypothetical protein